MKATQSDLFDRVEAQKLRDKGVNLAMSADRVTIWKAKAEGSKVRLKLTLPYESV